ncbi:MAG TPA: hypothetical protein VFB89_15680 [Gemmatimonadales bacterium]|nr:hypothetical protein [Gemmatimonadales bacterium]
MRPSHRALGLALALTLGAASIGSAQALGLPVYNSGVPTGLGIYGDVAFPDGAAGDGYTLGLSGRLGWSKLGVTATIASFNPSGADNTLTTWGATGNYKLIGGPLVPFSATVQGGVGYGRVGPDSTGVKTWHFPIGLGLALTIPNPALAIKPWIAPRIDITETSVNDGPSDTDSNFGMSAGIEFNFLNGFGLQTAYDRVFVNGDDPGIFSVGAHYAFRIPGL